MMRTRLVLALFVAIVLAGALLLAPPARAEAMATDLGTLGGAWSDALAVNNAGQVTGNSETVVGTIHGYLWSGGTMIDLGPIIVEDLNEAGQVAGWGSGPDGFTHAYLWTSGALLDLGRGIALGLNDLGQVVGVSPTAVAPTFPQATLWSGGDRIVLGTLGGATSEAWDINNAGQVMGVSQTASGEWHAFFWPGKGRLIDLRTFGGDVSDPMMMNEHGKIVGWSYTKTGTMKAFLWSRDKGLSRLPVPGGPAVESNALDVNERDHAVGWWYDPSSGVQHAVQWKEGSVVDLGSLGGTSAVADATNEQDHVAGDGTDVAGVNHAFFWTKETGMFELPWALGGVYAVFDINDVDQVVGIADGGSGYDRGVLWTVVLTPVGVTVYVGANVSELRKPLGA